VSTPIASVRRLTCWLTDDRARWITPYLPWAPLDEDGNDVPVYVQVSIPRTKTLVVDSLHSNQTAVMRSLNKPLTNLKGITEWELIGWDGGRACSYCSIGDTFMNFPPNAIIYHSGTRSYAYFESLTALLRCQEIKLRCFSPLVTVSLGCH
jgi:hypothetical protein